jgi:hypothetical protein
MLLTPRHSLPSTHLDQTAFGRNGRGSTFFGGMSAVGDRNFNVPGPRGFADLAHHRMASLAGVLRQELLGQMLGHGKMPV